MSARAKRVRCASRQSWQSRAVCVNQLDTLSDAAPVFLCTRVCVCVLIVPSSMLSCVRRPIQKNDLVYMLPRGRGGVQRSACRYCATLRLRHLSYQAKFYYHY